MGSKKTFDQIASHFSWPGLSFDVRKYCATCPQCQLVARKLKSKRAPLKPVEIVTEPFKKIAIDIVGELPRTTTGYKYILTIVDYENNKRIDGRGSIDSVFLRGGYSR